MVPEQLKWLDVFIGKKSVCGNMYVFFRISVLDVVFFLLPFIIVYLFLFIS